MKENLFRGKQRSGKWVEGSLVKVSVLCQTFFLVFGPEFFFDGQTVKSLEHAAIIPETAGQFTGMRDKNGVRIFEGDIVTDGKKLYEIDFMLTGYYCKEKTPTGYNAQPLSNFFDAFGPGLEIVGNIHDGKKAGK